MHALAALTIATVAILPAHAAVIDSTVENGETLTEAPASFSVTMNEEILQVAGVETANVLYLQDANGNYYGDGCVTVEGATASIESALGEPGEYTFSYTVVSSDTHPVSDTFNFTWDPSGDFQPAEGQAEAPTCGDDAEAPAESDDAAGDETATEDTQTEQTDADATDEPASDDAITQEEQDAGLPGWAFALISVALLALIIGIIVGNWLKARRQFGDAAPEAPEDEKPEDQR